MELKESRGSFTCDASLKLRNSTPLSCVEEK